MQEANSYLGGHGRRPDAGAPYGYSATESTERPVKSNGSTQAVENHESKTVPDEGSLQARLYEFYSRHQPNIAPRARVIAKQYEGREDVLNRNLRQTYGVDLTSNEPSSTPHRDRPNDVVQNGDNAAGIKDDAKSGAARAAPQARPISAKQFMALLHRKDIVPRCTTMLRDAGCNMSSYPAALSKQVALRRAGTAVHHCPQQATPSHRQSPLHPPIAHHPNIDTSTQPARSQASLVPSPRHSSSAVPLPPSALPIDTTAPASPFHQTFSHRLPSRRMPLKRAWRRSATSSPPQSPPTRSSRTAHFTFRLWRARSRPCHAHFGADPVGHGAAMHAAWL
jgi:hypothetical protein